MHQVLKFYLKFFSIILLIALVGMCGYYKMNGLLDIWLCDYCCRDNPQYTQYLTNETKVIGIYKINVARCECFIIEKNMEKLFRQEMERRRYNENFLDKWSKKLYSDVKLILKRKKK